MFHAWTMGRPCFKHGQIQNAKNHSTGISTRVKDKSKHNHSQSQFPPNRDRLHRVGRSGSIGEGMYPITDCFFI